MNQLHLASSNPIQRLNLSHCNKTKCFKENTQLLSWWRSQMTWNRRYVQYMKTQVCCLMTECQLPKDRFSELNIAWCKTGTLTLGMLDKEYFFQVFAALVGTAWPCSVIFSIHQMFGHILALAVQRYFWTIKQSWKKIFNQTGWISCPDIQQNKLTLVWSSPLYCFFRFWKVYFSDSLGCIFRPGLAALPPRIKLPPVHSSCCRLSSLVPRPTQPSTVPSPLHFHWWPVTDFVKPKCKNTKIHNYSEQPHPTANLSIHRPLLQPGRFFSILPYL